MPLLGENPDVGYTLKFLTENSGMIPERKPTRIHVCLLCNNVKLLMWPFRRVGDGKGIYMYIRTCN